eukprot:6460031-Amphidinium_carterae.1
MLDVRVLSWSSTAASESWPSDFCTLLNGPCMLLPCYLDSVVVQCWALVCVQGTTMTVTGPDMNRDGIPDILQGGGGAAWSSACQSTTS